MAHVGVQGLGPGDRENDRAQCEEGDGRVLHGELHGVDGRQGAQDLRVLDNAPNAACGDRREPDDHHRSEEPAHRRRSTALHREQQGEDDHGDGNHEVGQLRAHNLQPLDSGQHRDRRGDHAVAEKQRGTEDAQAGEKGGGTNVSPAVAAQKGDEGHHTAFAVVVGPHDEQHVGEGDDGHD